VEVATLRVAPPAVLVDRVPSYPALYADLYPITIACADPRGDLPHSRSIPHGSRLALTGSPQVGELRADRELLVAALRQIAPSTPGIFYYSGHLVEGGRGGDVEDGLGLANGEVLEAESIFQATEDGRPAIPFPSRGLIAACESVGAGGSGAGE
jgi:hypothetical protein